MRNMRKFNLLAAIAAVSLAGGTAAAAAAEEDRPVKAVKEKKICKGLTSTNSRIAKKRICKTRAEWAATGNQEDLDDAAGRMRGMSRGN